MNRLNTEWHINLLEDEIGARDKFPEGKVPQHKDITYWRVPLKAKVKSTPIVETLSRHTVPARFDDLPFRYCATLHVAL
jgi:hypothetical protein